MIIKDTIDPVRADLKKGGQIVAISSDTRPGTLVGIDKIYYQIAYPDTSVIYGLYPIREPDPANLAPLKDGELNCVAQRVIEHFEGALRGQGLTPARRRKIQDWEEKVRESGAKVDDVAELEEILKRAIILKDIAGEDIYNSGKYQACKWKQIELIAHNGHTFSNKLRFPRAREVHVYIGDIWQAITQAIEGQPIIVWLLGGGRDKELNIDQFVLQDGRAFKTKYMHERLVKACAGLGNEDLAGQWRNKGEFIYSRWNHAAYSPKPEFWKCDMAGATSSTPNYDDPISRHQISYLNGDGGSGKTTRTIKLFEGCNPLMLTPTHHLAKEGRKKGVQAQTYHSFFKWSGGRRAKATFEDLMRLKGDITVWKANRDWSPSKEILVRVDGEASVSPEEGSSASEKEQMKQKHYVARKAGDTLHDLESKDTGSCLSDMDWSPERMGQKFIPRVIIWDKICTVPLEILGPFLDFLKSRGTQVICCGDHGQWPPIGGESPHDWLFLYTDFYEEILSDYRAKCPELRKLKKDIRLKSDKEQFDATRKAIPPLPGVEQIREQMAP